MSLFYSEKNRKWQHESKTRRVGRQGQRREIRPRRIFNRKKGSTPILFA